LRIKPIVTLVGSIYPAAYSRGPRIVRFSALNISEEQEWANHIRTQHLVDVIRERKVLTDFYIRMATNGLVIANCVVLFTDYVSAIKKFVARLETQRDRNTIQQILSITHEYSLTKQDLNLLFSEI